MNIDDLTFIPRRQTTMKRNVYSAPTITVASTTSQSIADDLTHSQRRALFLVADEEIEFDGNQWFLDDKALSRQVSSLEWLLEEDYITIILGVVTLTEFGSETIIELRKNNHA